MDDNKVKTILCPRCGKKLPVEVVEVEGRTVLKVYCKRCHSESVVKLGRQ